MRFRECSGLPAGFESHVRCSRVCHGLGRRGSGHGKAELHSVYLSMALALLDGTTG